MRVPSPTFISEQEAAEMMGYAPRVFRQKVMATNKYKLKNPLPIRMTSAGKGYRYCKDDIERLLIKTAV